MLALLSARTPASTKPTKGQLYFYTPQKPLFPAEQTRRIPRKHAVLPKMKNMSCRYKIRLHFYVFLLYC